MGTGLSCASCHACCSSNDSDRYAAARAEKPVASKWQAASMRRLAAGTSDMLPAPGMEPDMTITPRSVLEKISYL